MSFGGRLRYAREAAGLTQKQLSRQQISGFRPFRSLKMTPGTLLQCSWHKLLRSCEEVLISSSSKESLNPR